MTDLFPTSVEKEAVERAIRTRRTIQIFKLERPDDGLILEALQLARWAPNHKLTEPWRFYMMGPESASKLAVLNAELVRQTRGEAAAQNKLNRWRSIPGWLVLTCRRSEDSFREKEDYAACCCAAQNLMLFLWSRGVGMKWTTGPVTRSEAFCRLIGIDPEAEFVVSLFMYGFPDETPHADRADAESFLSILP